MTVFPEDYLELLRALIAAQCAVLEHQAGEHNFSRLALDTCLKKAARLAAGLGK